MTALVTGAGRGIGKAIAVALARAGHGPVAIVARTAEQLGETATVIRGAGGEALALAADLADPEQVVAAVARATAELGPIDVLVNNAGISGASSRLSDGDAAPWRDVMLVNVVGPALVASLVVPGMVARGSGCVINIGSLQGSRPFPGFAAYGASKAALMRLTDALAAELDGTGVVAFDVSPGLVDTEMTRTGPLGKVLVDVPTDEWTPIENVMATVVALADRRYDALSGRFVHAEDDLDDVVRRISADGDDARRLRMTPAGSDDPLFA